MKRFKILSVLILICFVIASVQQIIVEGSEGFQYGVNTVLMEQKYGKKADMYLLVDLLPHVSDSVYMEVENLKNGEMIKIIPNRASMMTFSEDSIEPSKTERVLGILNQVLNLLILALYVYFIVLFFKIIITFSRARVFEEKNIVRLNKIGYGFLLIGLLGTIWQCIRVYVASKAIQLANYDITYAKTIDWDNIIVGLIILIMTEILRVAVGLKREQELTI